MTNKQVRSKTVPFRVLVFLVWGKHSFATWEGDRVRFRASEMCRVFRVSRNRLWECLEFLEKFGLVKDLEAESTRKFAMTVVKPARWQEDSTSSNKTQG